MTSNANTLLYLETPAAFFLSRKKENKLERCLFLYELMTSPRTLSPVSHIVHSCSALKQLSEWFYMRVGVCCLVLY